MNRLQGGDLRQCCYWVVMIAVAAATISGCATPPPAGPAARAGASTPAPAVTAQPVAPAAPALSPPQARAQSQRLAIEAVDQLQNGDEAAARALLEQAIALDGSNELARKLMDQIVADPEKDLGSVFFRYTVQRDDSMSKLAQQYLGDRFRFYILARYNDIANPSRLAAGQVIRIPGKAPAAAPAVAVRPSEPAARAPEPPAPPQRDADNLLEKGIALQRAGNLEGAYAAFSEAAAQGGSRDAVLQRDAIRKVLIRRYDREATQAFQRQNLDLAIARWSAVLKLDPANQKAALERDRAADLKRRMSEKFGTK